MKLFKYRILYRNEAMNQVDDFFKLTYDQRRIFYDNGEWLPFDILVDKNQEVKTSFSMRLTYPFFMVIVLLMIIFSPIYYICTGKWAYEYKQKPFSWIWEWGKKLEFF